MKVSFIDEFICFLDFFNTLDFSLYIQPSLRGQSLEGYTVLYQCTNQGWFEVWVRNFAKKFESNR
jgi:hypothetical protein